MNLKYLTHAESAFYTNPYSRGHFIDSYNSSYTSVPPVWYDYCESSAHDASFCPCRDYFDAQCASVEKRINELTAKMVETMKVQITEYSHGVTQSRENCNQLTLVYDFLNLKLVFMRILSPLIILGLA